MARNRTAALGASCLLVLAGTLGGAAAQTAGGPLPLLQIDHATTTVHAHHKAAVRTARTRSPDRPDHRHVARRGHAKTRVADAGGELPAPPATAPTQPAPQNGSQGVWPAQAAAALPGTAGMPGASPADAGSAPLAPAPASSPGAVTTEQVVGTDPNGILNGSHTVPAAVPAGTPAATPAPSTAVKVAAASAPLAKPAVMQPAAPASSAPVKVAAAAPKAPIRAMLFRLGTSGPVGSASWIAQLLAALGGAIAAGAIAWFLIRSRPEQNYG